MSGPALPWQGAPARWAEAHPEAEALAHGPRRLSWQELTAYIDSAAGVLADLGVGPGDAVAVQQGKAVEEIVTLYAVARIGAVAVPLPPTLKAPQVAAALRDTAAVAIVLHRARVRALAPALVDQPRLRALVSVGPPLPPDAPFLPPGLPVASLLDAVKRRRPQAPAVCDAGGPAVLALRAAADGTWAPHPWPHGALSQDAQRLAAALALGAGHTLLSVVSYSVAAGVIPTAAAWGAGARVVLQRDLSVLDILDAPRADAITHLVLTPEHLHALLAQPWTAAAWPDLQALALTGPVSAATLAALLDRLPSVALWCTPIDADGALGPCGPLDAAPAAAAGAWHLRHGQPMASQALTGWYTATGLVADVTLSADDDGLTIEARPLDEALTVEALERRVPGTRPGCLQPDRVRLTGGAPGALSPEARRR